MTVFLGPGYRLAVPVQLSCQASLVTSMSYSLLWGMLAAQLASSGATAWKK